MPTSPEEAMATMIGNLKEKTGKDLDAWIRVAKASGESKHGGIVSHLKSKHGMGHGYANLVAHKTLSSDAVSIAEGGADLIEAQYSGAKAGLRPIHDALTAAMLEFGADVEFSPKKAYISVRRSKQFAIIQPSTATRVDIGINLKGVAPAGRLEASGSFNAMVSHRVRVEQAGDVNAELIGWLKEAYEKA